MQTIAPKQEIIYPETDGQPMANNTKQAQAMIILKENLDALYAHNPDVFIAIDHFWYPVEGRPDIRQAPDVMVVFGRPKGHRGSYKQWEEGGIVPQVVFEVLSPSNTMMEMGRKFAFYEQYGVQEYYVYDPETGIWEGAIRRGERLEPIEQMEGWVSPLLGIRFERGSEDDIGIRDSQGNPFRYFVEVREALLEAIARERQRAEEERQRAEEERQRAEEALRQAEEERKRAEQLAQRLRELGIDPDAQP